MIVVLGESLIDLIPQGREQYFAALGGGPANVAVALARQGAETGYLGRLSTDHFGRQLRARLTSNGVAVDQAVEAAENSSLAVVALDDSGAASYRFYLEGTADWQWTSSELPADLEADALHIGSLALVVEPGAKVLADWIDQVRREGRVLLSYDPNVRRALAAGPEVERARFERYAALAHLIKASDEDLDYLYPGASLDEAAARALAAGAELVVVTRGGDGASAYRSGGRAETIAAFPVNVVDTVGAGDAFAAGLLASLAEDGVLGQGADGVLERLDDAVLRRALTRAAVTAALTCSRQGADAPARAEIRAVLGNERGENGH